MYIMYTKTENVIHNLTANTERTHQQLEQGFKHNYVHDAHTPMFVMF